MAAFLTAVGAPHCSSIVPPRGTGSRQGGRSCTIADVLGQLAVPVVCLPACWPISSAAVVTCEYLICLMR